MYISLYYIWYIIHTVHDYYMSCDQDRNPGWLVTKLLQEGFICYLIYCWLSPTMGIPIKIIKQPVYIYRKLKNAHMFYCIFVCSKFSRLRWRKHVQTTCISVFKIPWFPVNFPTTKPWRLQLGSPFDKFLFQKKPGLMECIVAVEQFLQCGPNSYKFVFKPHWL